MDINDEYMRYVPNAHFELIPIKNLVSNQDYQRNLSQTHIAKAVENFDLFQINPVKVSRRDGINYVFNGQHTIEIIATVSGSRETPVWCMIYDELTYKHEADIFANQQKYVKPLLPFEVFNANIEAGSETQLTIKALVESYGLNLGPKRAHNTITAVATVESIYIKYGYHVLNRVLRLIIGAWEGDPNSFSGNILNAVTRLVTVYGDKLSDEVFKEKVGSLSLKQLARTAKERRQGSMGYAETMVLVYNGKKKNSHFRLGMQKLYAKDNDLFAGLQEEDDGSEADQETLDGFDPLDEDDEDYYSDDE